MKTLLNYLEESGVGEELTHVVISLADCVKKIADSMDKSHDGKAGSQNVFGEEQLALDLIANEIIVYEMEQNKHVGIVASEEMEEEKSVGEGEYGVCFDPLDGSSLVDVNLSVGSIFGIYKTKTFFGVRGDNQLASMIAVYGPKTTILLTVRHGVCEFLLRSDGEFVLTRENLQVGPGKMFAPGNLRACSKRKDYLKLLDFWAENNYTLRYSGAMTPDVAQIMLKGKGIFTYPGYDEQPDGKLRLLYECAPMALLMEECSGMATDGNLRILQKDVESLSQRTPILIGSSEEVQRAMDMLQNG
ncbi:fructose-1,6-bisphosphatase [Candidatus Peregrinibacteria bacterium]|nr:fructose-1,6-bisphosphatase [Candidatus Peregrinibacteria bacterium]